MKKIFYASMLFILLLAGCLIIYAKRNIRHLSFSDYNITSKYQTLSKEEYESMFYLDDFFIDSNLNSPKDLYDLSEYIVIVTVNNKEFAGHGIINNCSIEKVIKGNDLKVNDNIKIYDLVAIWTEYATMYLDGSTPLAPNAKYIVFLKKAVNGNILDSYVFTSIDYGYIRLDSDLQIIEDYDNNSLMVGDSYFYQHIFTLSESDKIDEYEKKYLEIKQYMETYGNGEYE